MKRSEIKFCLVYRDMWQSAGKYVPRVEQLCEVAAPIIDMDCFHRVETNGGGFEQVNLLFGENPNVAVRRWTQPFNDAGIQTQMLERGLNGIRMSPVPRDVRKLMFKVKKKQGTDIARSFDGLNNPQNLALSFQYAKEGGMIAQGALSITHSPIHTADYYIQLADSYIDLGAEEICIKDMAGVGRPTTIGKIVKGIRERHPNIIIQYHGHSTPGFSIVSSLEAARQGADIIDVGMEPLSWGTGHADLLTVRAMLDDAGFKVPEVNMKAYMEVRSLTQKYMDDFLGEFINPQNRVMNSLLIGPGLPGGMMGSLMADLESNLKSLNKWMLKQGKEVVSQDELLIALFNEVEHIWPKLGYPPLVTPFSQYVKNVALMNVIQHYKGKARWSMIDENTWDMILGKSGELPGRLDSEIINLAKDQDREFYTGDPQDLFPDVLDEYRQKMQKNGWDLGQDEEELMEYAMHPRQYEDYKNGKAKTAFQEVLAAKKAVSTPISEPQTSNPEPQTPNPEPTLPTDMTVNIDGQNYRVSIAYNDQQEPQTSFSPGGDVRRTEGATRGDVHRTEGATRGDVHRTEGAAPQNGQGTYAEIVAPLEGKFYLTKDPGEKGVQLGDQVSAGDVIGYIEAMKVLNAVTADKSGTIVDILAKHGEEIDEDDPIIKVK